MTQAALIALDWGTSNLRASLLDARGHPLETRAAAGGVMAVKNGAFSEALVALCGDWLLLHDCPLLASGMIGSRQGWKEAPYLSCPAGISDSAGVLTTVAIAGTGASATEAQRVLHVVPGLQDKNLPAWHKVIASQRVLHIVPGLQYADSSGAYDVMRGEETQIWGAALPAGSICILPGTHSKWAWLDGRGAIGHFRTFMTGELYGLLTQHGILGRLMVFGHDRRDDFVAGVRYGITGHGQLSHAIFAARTAGLMGQVEPQGLPDYLSGILIGGEIGAVAHEVPQGARQLAITLIGDDDLCARYELACEAAGLPTRRAAPGATTAGQWLVARAAGLVPAST